VQFGEQPVGGPGVGDHVVQRDHEDVVVGHDAYQQGAGQRSRREVERAATVGDHEPASGLDVTGRVHSGHRQRRGRRHDLDRFAVLLGERRPQGRVPGHDHVQRALEQVRPQRTGQAQWQRHVVDRIAGREPVQEPQPPLAERQRVAPWPFRPLFQQSCRERPLLLGAHPG
jgi:hypothetical protein